jgi:glucose-6-phosphate isomerase
MSLGTRTRKTSMFMEFMMHAVQNANIKEIKHENQPNKVHTDREWNVRANINCQHNFYSRQHITRNTHLKAQCAFPTSTDCS